MNQFEFGSQVYKDIFSPAKITKEMIINGLQDNKVSLGNAEIREEDNPKIFEALKMFVLLDAKQKAIEAKESELFD